MQIKKTQICDRLSNWSVSWNFPFQLPIISQLCNLKICYFLKNSLLFNTFYCLFCFYTNSLRLTNLKSKDAMNSKPLGLVIYDKVIFHLLSYNLRGCTFKSQFVLSKPWKFPRNWIAFCWNSFVMLHGLIRGYAMRQHKRFRKLTI